MRAKICGITTLADALMAIDMGAFALGFNFYPSSPRHIALSQAKAIIEQLPSTVITVGIYLEDHSLARVFKDSGVDLLQVYADVKAPLSLKQQMILSINPQTERDIPDDSILQQYAYVLLDAPKTQDGVLGGSGRLSHWQLGVSLAKQYRVILAGGLNAINVREAIDMVHPYAVDVASGVQSVPGVLDRHLLNAFLTEVQYAS